MTSKILMTCFSIAVYKVVSVLFATLVIKFLSAVAVVFAILNSVYTFISIVKKNHKGSIRDYFKHYKFWQ